MTRAEKAKEYFESGYNCSQSVAMAFADVMGMDVQMVAKLASGLGGGVGRLREVCGAVTGMTLAAGMLYGFDEPDRPEIKTEMHLSGESEKNDQATVETGCKKNIHTSSDVGQEKTNYATGETDQGKKKQASEGAKEERGLSAHEKKAALYALVQKLAGEFKETNGSIICRELLAGINSDTNPVPEARTANYYAKRPCAELVYTAAEILDAEIKLRLLQSENK